MSCLLWISIQLSIGSVRQNMLFCFFFVYLWWWRPIGAFTACQKMCFSKRSSEDLSSIKEPPLYFLSHVLYSMTYSFLHASKPLSYSPVSSSAPSNSLFSLLTPVIPIFWFSFPPPPSVSLEAFVLLYSPWFWQPRGTQSAISKQFITCRMFWVQYPSSHLNATSITHRLFPSRRLSILSQKATEWVFCLKGYFPCTNTHTHTHTQNHNLLDGSNVL